MLKSAEFPIGEITQVSAKLGLGVFDLTAKFYHALSAKPRRLGLGCKDALDFFAHKRN
jgi:hypothetical protein